MPETVTPRRSFLARFATGFAVVGVAPALSAIGCASADSAPSADSGAAPADDLDTWLGTLTGSNRVIYDGVAAGGGPDAIIFARNFLKFSEEKLGTRPEDMQVIVSFRHFATPYGFNDAMWAKYPFGSILKIDDPTTKQAAVRNVPLHDEIEGQSGASLPALAARGVNFTVCGAATEFLAKMLAGTTGDAKAIESELAANLIPNGRIVPAGVVVLQRAQKAGFAYTLAG